MFDVTERKVFHFNIPTHLGPYTFAVQADSKDGAMRELLSALQECSSAIGEALNSKAAGSAN